MYCINCGNKINDSNDKYCTNCGVKLDKIENSNVGNNDNNGMKITSIILGSISILGSLTVFSAPASFILAIIGLVVGICALKLGKNTLGILLNVIGFVLSIIMSIVLIFIFMYKEDGYDYRNDNNYEYYDNFYGERF